MSNQMEHLSNLDTYFYGYRNGLDLTDDTWMKIGKQNHPEQWLGAYELECSLYVYRDMIQDNYIT